MSAGRVPPWRNRRVLVPLYFACGGLSGGLFALGTLAELMHAPHLERVTAIAYRSAFPLIVFGSLLLLLDLTKPWRFYRLLTHFNPRSPVSLGSYGLIVYGGISFIAMLASLLGRTTLPVPLLAVGLLAALFIASYTGVLLTASSKPAWNASPLMGGIFLAISLASATAVMLIALTLAPRPAELESWLRRLLLCCLGVQALLSSIHLWRADRLPVAERGGHVKLVRGRLGAALLASLLLSFALPLLLPLSWTSASALTGGFVFRYVIFLAEE